MVGRNFGSLVRRSTLGLRGRVRLRPDEDHVRFSPAMFKPDSESRE